MDEIAFTKLLLEQSDREMPRAVEDLCEKLLQKGILIESDLPPQFRERIDEKKALRAKLHDLI